MKKEEKVEILLWDWLKTHSLHIEEIYFNRKNKLNWFKFKVKGIQKKPDLIIKIYGRGYCVVEVKDCSKSKNVLGGNKIIDTYFKNYIEKKTKYYINDKEIKINYFVIATQSSLKGYLFKNEDISDNSSNIQSRSKYLAATKYKIIPTKEGNRTFEFVRMLWHDYGKIRKNYKEKCGVGILIGNITNNLKPYLMITDYDENKKRWGQRFLRL